MTPYLWILVLAGLAGSRAQDLDLFDALGDDPTPAPAAPKKPPKADDGNLDLFDALGPDPTPPPKPKKPAGDPSKNGGAGDFNIFDAVDNDPKKPSGGGGFSDSDLTGVAGNDEYKPDAGRGGRGGAQASDTSDSGGGAEPQAEQSGQMAGIISAVGVAILGMASSYFAYQKKKLCFKVQGGADPESGRNQSGTQSEPQVLSNLLKSS